MAGALGGLAASVARMAVAYSIGKKRLAEHEPTLRAHAAALERLAAVCLQLGDEDAAAYAELNRLQRLPEGDPGRAGLEAAASAAVGVPMACLAAATDLLARLEALVPITNAYLRSDIAVGAVAAEACARAAWWNVRANLAAVGDAERAVAAGEADTMLADARAIASRVESSCLSA